MQPPKSFTPEAVLRGYFHAKDENRPHMLEDVFASNAELVIHNQSANIAFPAFTQGRSAIAEVLVRSFALSNENVYSFYPRPSAAGRSRVHLPLAGGHVRAVFGPRPRRLRHLRVGVRAARSAHGESACRHHRRDAGSPHHGIRGGVRVAAGAELSLVIGGTRATEHSRKRASVSHRSVSPPCWPSPPNPFYRAGEPKAASRPLARRSCRWSDLLRSR